MRPPAAPQADPELIRDRASRIRPLDSISTLREYDTSPLDPFDDTRMSIRCGGREALGLRHVACLLAAVSDSGQPAEWLARFQRAVLAQLPAELDGIVVAFSFDAGFDVDYGPALADGQRSLLVNLYSADGPAETLADPRPVRIPVMDDTELRRHAERITPLAIRDGELVEIDRVDPVDVAYLWDPTYLGVAQDMEPVVDIRTFHTYGAPSLFKPSIGEVIRQIPPALLDDIDAFSLSFDDDTSGAFADSGRLHTATATLYRRASTTAA